MRTWVYSSTYGLVCFGNHFYYEWDYDHDKNDDNANRLYTTTASENIAGEYNLMAIVMVLIEMISWNDDKFSGLLWCKNYIKPRYWMYKENSNNGNEVMLSVVHANKWCVNNNLPSCKQ